MTIQTANVLDFSKSFKAVLADYLQEGLESGEVIELLPEVLDEAKEFDAAEGVWKREFNVKGKRGTNEYHSKMASAHHRLSLGSHAQNHDTDYHKKAADHHSARAQAALHEEFGDEALEEHVRRDEIEADWENMTDDEKNLVIYLKELGRHHGSDSGAYKDGVLELVFKNKDGVNQFADALDEVDHVIGYEIEAQREVMVDGYVEDEEYDMDDVLFDKDFEFVCAVYIEPSIVLYSPEVIDVGEEGVEIDDENGFITEVRRRIKVNFRGKRRIKMQCRPGFKWDPGTHACLKITGSDVAIKRKAMRRAVRTRKAKGQSFKVRVLRKTRKAKRFRKSMGLKG